MLSKGDYIPKSHIPLTCEPEIATLESQSKGDGSMSKKAPGRAHRKGLTLLEVAEMFGDEASAKAWIVKQRWPDGPFCPVCGSVNVQEGIKHRTMTHRCRDCPGRSMFTLKIGTVMEGSKLSFRAWAVAIYLFTTNLKGLSSMKLHRELGIGQKAAWFLMHRLRKAFESGAGVFAGPVEVDETYVGGKRKNMSNAQRKNREGTGRGPVGKAAVVGVKDRKTKQVRAKAVESIDKETLQGFVSKHTAPGATVYTDDASAYDGLPFDHATVKHSLLEYVKGDVHTNGIESLWSMLKRAHKGTFHKLSPKHLDRYVQEFAGRHNIRNLNTLDQMASVVHGMEHKRLRYEDLIADNGLDSGARA